jgi:hypothetical protein
MKYLQEPIHFKQLAEFIRANNLNQKTVSDQTVYATLTKSKQILSVDWGIYALVESNLPKHLTAGKALVNLLLEKGPLLEDVIVEELRSRRFSLWSVKMALENNKNKLVRIGNDMYDLREEVYDDGKRY